ncbi:hypothetical protein JAAARDRAFT_53366 [Jaapia argillacea MUCL 33604]|uniref:Uncharacterized protein n=1 Tax=Jaapia argillacea MUCL 33604 TaxID=933084 RepID=A0A067Q841_9AGAM|nr:hypothetical protein JAAARDRAFT_53366 [Jaapia argillacea MUCL 33604]
MDIVLKGVAVGTAGVLLGSAGFILSVLASLFNLVIVRETPPLLTKPPSPRLLTHTLPSQSLVERVSIGPPTRRSDRVSDPSHTESPASHRSSRVVSPTSPIPSPHVSFESALSSPSRVETDTFSASSASHPISHPLPSRKSEKPARSRERTRSLSPSLPPPTQEQGSLESFQSLPGTSESQGASTPLPAEGRRDPKRRHTFGLLNLAHRHEKRKEPSRVVSSPTIPVISDPPSSSSHSRNASLTRRFTAPAGGSDVEITGSPLGSVGDDEERRSSRSEKTSKGLCPRRRRSRNISPPKPPPPPARTHPYEAPYFFPQPGSPEAIDYARRVQQERRLSGHITTPLPTSSPTNVRFSTESPLPPTIPPTIPKAKERRASTSSRSPGVNIIPLPAPPPSVAVEKPEPSPARRIFKRSVKA